MNILKILRENSILSSLSEDKLSSFSTICTQITIHKGHFVFFDKDTAKFVYILASGSVKIFKTSYDGDERILKLVKYNDFFAESAIFGHGNYPANAIALENSILLKICSQQLMEFLKSSPELAIKLLHTQSNRLREFTEKIEMLSSKNVMSRFIDFCNKYSKQVNGELIVNIKTIQMLADELGTTRETMSRIISKLTKNGSIKRAGTQLTITNIIK